MLLRVWSDNINAPNFKDRKVFISYDKFLYWIYIQVILIHDGHGYELSGEGDTTTRKERPELDSSQEETDTRVVLYARNAADMGYKVAHIKSPDSDIFFILLYHSSYLKIEVLFESGTGNRKRLLNISELNKKLSHRVCSSLLSLHALTGCIQQVL